MKKPILVAMCLMFTPVLAQAAQDSEYDRSTTMERANPDNTNINKRDRNEETLTPLDQSNTEADTKITQAIRKSIVKNDFSMDAKNIKIITQNGEVTLRGPVNNKGEAEKIAALAKSVPGIKTLNNQLEVK